MPFYHVIYFILAIIGLGLLVFLHELGHYIVAKRLGMKIQVFSVGFGKPFYSWMRGGVKWQLCYCLLGGYVKIAGMQKEGRTPPHKVKGGFYSKSPRDRIAVAIAGPLVNLVLAFVLFFGIWIVGGRLKPFSENTQLIGALDKRSALFDKGVRSGDKLNSFNGRDYRGIKDLMYTMVEKGARPITIEGERIDYFTHERTPFTQTVKPYPDPRVFDRDKYTIGVLAPASYLIYNDTRIKIPDGAPILGSGIRSGDRILWADGRMVFSQIEMSSLINAPTALVSVQRGSQAFLTRIPKLPASQISLGHYGSEVDDWQYAMGLRKKNDQLQMIPYGISSHAVVEQPLSYIDEKAESIPYFEGDSYSKPLQRGDRIVAIDGIPVRSGQDLFAHLQTKHVQLIVQRTDLGSPVNWKVADKDFVDSVDGDALKNVLDRLARGETEPADATIIALKSVEAIAYRNFPVPEKQRTELQHEFSLEEERISKIKDPAERARAENSLKSYSGRLMLGIPLVDERVQYNPGPISLFSDTMSDIWRTLSGLFSGNLSPKWVAGPVGIIQMLHRSWSLGLGEALFWLAVISLNLGILNLLPIPPFDGGHIVFSIYEGATGKRVNQKIMDRIVLAFVILLIGFALFITFHDVQRLFTLS